MLWIERSFALPTYLVSMEFRIALSNSSSRESSSPINAPQQTATIRVFLSDPTHLPDRHYMDTVRVSVPGPEQPVNCLLCSA